MVLEGWWREGTMWEKMSGVELGAQIMMWLGQGRWLYGYEDDWKSATVRGWDVGSIYMNRKRHGVGNHSGIIVCSFTCDSQHWGYRPWGGCLQWIGRKHGGATGKPTHSTKLSTQGLSCLEEMQGMGIMQRLGEQSTITGLSWDTSHGQAPVPDSFNGTKLCFQTGS